MNLDLTAFLGEFRLEATEHLDALNTQLLLFEREPANPELIRTMFLSAHTIKGSAAMLDLGDVCSVAHAMEDVLAYLRDERLPLDIGTADLLFQALDTLRTLVGSSTPGTEGVDAPTADLIVTLRKQVNVRNAARAAAMPDQDPASRPRALLVDDSATVRLLETMQLSDAGFHVDAVAGGREALSMALAGTYDLIVTGIECQGLRGWDLAAALHEVISRRPIPIVIMSSDDNPNDRERAEEAGLHAYLRKGSLGEQELVDVARMLVKPGSRGNT